jgi:hypothetical protein
MFRVLVALGLSLAAVSPAYAGAGGWFGPVGTVVLVVIVAIIAFYMGRKSR